MKLNFKKTPVIVISGKAGVGKTTLANYLVKMAKESSNEAVIIPFASGVKKIASLMYWDGKKDESGRQLLINIGKAGRLYDKDVWAKIAFGPLLDSKIDLNTDFIIVDDWRFPNECEYVESNKEYRVFKVRVFAKDREFLKGTSQYFDESETSLPEDFRQYNFCISNDGSLEMLQVKAKMLFDQVVYNMEKV
jgi:energy-coupling factor transporter ATP-binding protein EcfA2